MLGLTWELAIDLRVTNLIRGHTLVAVTVWDTRYTLACIPDGYNTFGNTKTSSYLREPGQLVIRSL